MPIMSSVYLEIDEFEITDVTHHYYEGGKADFKFNRNTRNTRIYIHLKSKEDQRMKLIYKDENGTLRVDSHLALTSVTCKDGVITVNMKR